LHFFLRRDRARTIREVCLNRKEIIDVRPKHLESFKGSRGDSASLQIEEAPALPAAEPSSSPEGDVHALQLLAEPVDDVGVVGGLVAGFGDVGDDVV